jgi:hypothetical protein
MNEKDNPRSKHYDSSWDDDIDNDEEEEEDGEETEDPLDLKMEQWDKRNWEKWLKTFLTFPFTATREEDMDEEPFAPRRRKPFAVGTKMVVTSIRYDDFHEAVFAQVKQGNEEAWIPLADLEVTPKSDPNFWAVREYVVWFAKQ